MFLTLISHIWHGRFPDMVKKTKLHSIWLKLLSQNYKKNVVWSKNEKNQAPNSAKCAKCGIRAYAQRPEPDFSQTSWPLDYKSRDSNRRSKLVKTKSVGRRPTRNQVTVAKAVESVNRFLKKNKLTLVRIDIYRTSFLCWTKKGGNWR